MTTSLKCQSIVLVMLVLIAPFCHGALSSKAKLIKDIPLRSIGPAVTGGRITSVEGVPNKPNIYYVGTAGGGVWKTTTGGMTWKPLLTKACSSSIGAIAIDPSNSKHIWVGTGEANPRNDVLAGCGLYSSNDGGKTWQYKGLKHTGSIAAVVMDPQNSTTIYVAALGSPWQPSKSRGVYKSTDNGQTWHHILYKDTHSGAVSLAINPQHPQIVYAALWTVKRHPWMLDSGGLGSGIFKTTDAGKTWRRLRHGLPDGPIGRIGLDIAPSAPNILYAVMGSKAGVLWKSTNAGNDWKLISDNHKLDVRPWYFSKVVVASHDPSHIFVPALHLYESHNSGKSAHVLDKGAHVDHHTLWLDPTNPRRMAEGTDGGLYMTATGGKTWRFINNLPIGQYYRISTGPGTPYTICGGLQDNGAWCGPPLDLKHGGELGLDWFNVLRDYSGDGQYAVISGPTGNIVYVDGQAGRTLRLNTKKDKFTYIRPYRVRARDVASPKTLRYRFNWISPIAVSSQAPDTIYLGANVIFRSDDSGQTWHELSPDLTRNATARQRVSGGRIFHDISGAENYDTIYSIALSPTNRHVIWTGTDDGLLQVTQDAGDSWLDVTPAQAPHWARVRVSVSPFNSAAAIAVFDNHMFGDRQPYAYITHDYGKHWRQISDSLPQDVPIHIVREDPAKKGVLFLGSDTGLYVSVDDGKHWQKFEQLPTSAIYDLKFRPQSSSLLVATHGRGIWVLDNLKPIEELNSISSSKPIAVFTAERGTLYNKQWHGNVLDHSGYKPPRYRNGVIYSYYVSQPKALAKQHYYFIIRSQHKLVARYNADVAQGLHEIEWNLRYQGPEKLHRSSSCGTTQSHAPSGPWVPPGTFTGTLETADGKAIAPAVNLVVRQDPRYQIPVNNFQSQTQFALKLRAIIGQTNGLINHVHAIMGQLDKFAEHLHTFSKRDVKVLQPMMAHSRRALSNVETKLYNSQKIQRYAYEDAIHYQTTLRSLLLRTLGIVESQYGQPPDTLTKQEAVKLQTRLQNEQHRYQITLKIIQQINLYLQQHLGGHRIQLPLD